MSPSYQVSSALATDRGRRRKHNEDYVAFFEPDDPEEIQVSGNLYIVADGVGGAIKGERASRFAAQKVLYEYYQYPQIEPEERLRKAMRLAGNEIYHYAQENEPFGRMATTMVAVVIRQDVLTVANVGDSRAYLIRDGNIQQITRDHTYVGEMVRSGTMTEEEAHSTRGKNRITRSLGGETNVKVDIFANIPLEPGDKILMCSDGLTRYASRQELTNLLENDTPETQVENLIDFANQRGGADNISAALISIGLPMSYEESIHLTSRGQTPVPVDWETIATIPITPEQDSGLFWLPITKTQVALISAIVLSLIAVCLLGANILLGNESVLGILSSESAGTTSSTPTQEFHPEEQVLPTDLPPTATVTPTPTATNVVPTGDAVANPVEITDCEYLTVPGDNIDTIITRFKSQAKWDEITCSLTDQMCSYNPNDPIYPEDPYFIEFDWYLVIPNVEPAICKENGGQVLEYE